MKDEMEEMMEELCRLLPLESEVLWKYMAMSHPDDPEKVIAVPQKWTVSAYHPENLSVELRTASSCIHIGIDDLEELKKELSLKRDLNDYDNFSQIEADEEDE